MLDSYWYHRIELSPGVYTPGQGYTNVGLTRKILQACQVKDKTCLDVGTMDGLISVLLSRRGARRVIACDRYDRRAQIDIVTRMLRADIEYLSHISLPEVRSLVPHLVGDPFDLVVFSGILYHMYDPMTGIGLIRSMVRPGGLVIIETQAVLSQKSVSYFNASGKLADDCHNYWNLSVELLDYFLRYFRLKPLDCAYFLIDRSAVEDGSPLLRICVPCQAVPVGLPDPGDAFMVVDARDDDADFPEWPAKTRTALSYTPSPIDLVRRASGAVNLYETVLRTKPVVVGANDVRLALGACF